MKSFNIMMATRSLFAYGTLIDTGIMLKAAGELPPARGGTLAGYESRTVKDKTYPGLLEKPGASVRGVLYIGLSDKAWERLDRFEGEAYVKKEVLVALDDGSSALALVYLTAPAHLHELSDHGWDYEEFRARGKADFVELYEGFER